jgi:hypothetical protein
LFYFSLFLRSFWLLVKPTFIGGCCFFSGFFTQSPQKTKNMYNPNRLSGIRRAKPIANPIDFCAVLPDNRRTFDWFQSFVVALAKSQDRRVIYGVFAFGSPYSTRQQRICMDGLEENTDIRTHPLYCRPALVKRLVKHLVHRWKQGQMYKRINPSSALGRFCF